LARFQTSTCAEFHELLTAVTLQSEVITQSWVFISHGSDHWFWGSW